MELNPSRTAVIAMHLQNDIVTAGGAMGSFFAAQVESRGIIGVVGTLLTTARRAGATVVYTRVAWQPGYTDMHANSPLLQMTVRDQSLIDGTENAEIISALKPENTDLIIAHQRVGSFAGTQLDTLLRGRGIDTVIFAGVATNVSVEGTARQASDLGYRTIIAADACSAAGAAAHDASIASLGLLAEISASIDILAALRSGPTIAAALQVDTGVRVEGGSGVLS